METILREHYGLRISLSLVWQAGQFHCSLTGKRQKDGQNVALLIASVFGFLLSTKKPDQSAD